jgi:hypothetical protein
LVNKPTEQAMTMDTAVRREGWKDNLTRILNGLPAGHEIELARLVVRANPPSSDEMADEILARAARGDISAVYRVYSPETRMPLQDFPSDTTPPSDIYDDTVGDTVRLAAGRDIELIVRGAARQP